MKLVLLTVLSLLAFLPLSSQAAPGLEVYNEGPDFAGARYEQSVVDLKVKVQGGFIRHQRRLENGIEWQFNRAWRGLEFVYAIGADPETELSIEIKRNDYSYPSVGGNTPTYVFDERKSIIQTLTGWRWQDREGNSIDYDAGGKATAYSDRNGVKVTLTRDAEGRLETVKDHNNLVVLTYSYNIATGLLESVTDYTNRSVSYTYNATGLLETVTDVRGEVWTYGYTSYAKGDIQMLTSITDPKTNVKTIAYEIQSGLACVESTGGGWSFDGTSWGFNNASCLTTSSQPASAILKSVSDDEGLLYSYKFFYKQGATILDHRYQVATVDGANGLEVVTYDFNGQVLEVNRNGRIVAKTEIEGRTYTTTDENGRQTSVATDQWRNPVKETYADGTFITREYDTTYSNITKYTDENGVVTKYDYYPNGNLQRMTEALGLPEQRITEYTYDLFGNQTQIKTLADAVTAEAVIDMTYDDFGNLKTYTDGERHVTEYLVHDVLGNVKQRKDARLNVWNYEFDEVGNLVSETTPLGFVTGYGYDKVGNLEVITDADLKVSSIGYDKRNRPISITNQLLETSTLAYNGRDQVTSATNALGHVILVEYDQDGQRTRVIDPSGNSTTWDYGYSGSNSFKGEVNTITYPTFEESLSYDERYRLNSSQQSSTDTLARSTGFTFDPAGNLKTSTDAKNRTSENNQDSLDRTISILDTAQQLTQLAYDSRDNLTQVTNARSIAIRQYQYDRNNQVLKELLPDGSTLLESRYDANGNLDLTIDGKGQVADYIYDIDNRLQQLQYFTDIASAANPLNALKTVDFTYDKLNRIKTYSDGSTSGSYIYDAAGQLKQSTVNYGSFSLSHAYTYYASGLKKTYTSPDNITYTYIYDTGGKLQSVTIPGQGNYTINQYKWMQPELVTLPGGGQISVDYDGYMRGRRIQGLDPAGNQILDALYTFDPLDNIEVREALEAKYEYDYDGVDRLTDVHTTLTDEVATSSRTYSHDPVGNRETDSAVTDGIGNPETWIYDDNDRLQQRGNITYEYDLNGSRTKQTDSGTGEIRNYVYNFENRLSEIRNGTNNLIASYQYDPFGRRISKTVGTTTTYYYYNDQGLAAEADGIGTVTTTYGYQLNTPWGTDPMFIKQGGQYGYYITDHLGTPQRVVGGNGAVLWSGVYDAFGDANITSETITSNLRFPGQYYDAESGLHYNFFRYYDVEVGRYITSDPIGLLGGVNTNEYAYSNPVRHIDPKGQLVIPAVYVIGAVILTGAAIAAAIQASNSGDGNIPSPAPNHVVPVDPAPLPEPNGPDRCYRDYLKDKSDCANPAKCPTIMSKASCYINAYIKYKKCRGSPPDDKMPEVDGIPDIRDPGFWDGGG